MIKRIGIERIARSRHQLAVTYFADALRFSTTHWWQNVDLGPGARFHTHAFEALWASSTDMSRPS